MKKIKLYIAVSLDGYIATSDGGVEWLHQFQISENEDYGYKEVNLTTTENVHFITNHIMDNVQRLKEQEGKDIWLVGGGELVSMLINADLIDEMQLCYLPIVLGQGISLFPNKPKETVWKLLDSRSFDSGAILISYSK